MTGKLFEQELLSYLITGSAALFALVSDRIYPMILPQNSTMPTITYQKIPGGTHFHSTDGYSGAFNGRFQFNCFHLTKSGARGVADELIATIGHWTGTQATSNDDWDFYENDTQLFKSIVDVLILGD